MAVPTMTFCKVVQAVIASRVELAQIPLSGVHDIGLFATPDTDTITDFNLLGDKIDATALLTALGWNGNDATLSQFVSASGTTINIHDTANTKSVNIVVTGQSFADFEDMINKTNFQT